MLILDITTVAELLQQESLQAVGDVQALVRVHSESVQLDQDGVPLAVLVLKGKKKNLLWRISYMRFSM